ncbi:uncharacterized protein TNCV_2586451 [Trichonephila clavipes]|nr:uncharacterized protein TNCV_2586451 [Trichonephila clavipes]
MYCVRAFIRDVTNGSPEREISGGSYHRIERLELKKLIPKFNSKEDDMEIFLKLFERQLKYLKVPDSQWDAYLIGTLPSDIVTLIAWESDEKEQDYAHVKEMFLR